ncbi:MAG: zinc metalloprotease HtpX [Pyrinomonadaceae bacterium]|nr:zinc metalloprotease HtpX [Pyrinomonadaceae bacterium]MCX7639996.1 zinc metalloprotease HtpX [Pyrinomonadaceae bacterium]MDW8304168.1 zinc metalloprotease HtpX [Acidobacteriota bacterium]
MLNRLKTVALLGFLTALFLFIGNLLGGYIGLVIAAVLAAFMNFGAYWFSDRIVLRMYNAKEVGRSEAPELYEMIAELSKAANIPMPRVYIIPEESPNAFATGRNPKNAAVAVTEGILQLLDRKELYGVLAHEIAHIKNRDTLIMTVAGALAGAISFLADMAFWSSIFGGSDDEEGSNPVVGILAMIVAPLAAMLIQFSISRSREFIADETGARLSGDPLALASALRKIEAWSQRIPIHSGNQATSHLFIVNPFSGMSLSRLFSTHPATEERIKRLEAMRIV